jgi:hypothetical protein
VEFFSEKRNVVSCPLHTLKEKNGGFQPYDFFTGIGKFLNKLNLLQRLSAGILLRSGGQ